MIFDTTFLIDILRNDQHALEKLEEITKSGEPQHITAVSVFELFSGVVRSQKQEQEKKNVLDILNSQNVLDFDTLAGIRAGQIDGQLIRQGNMNSPQDNMIAGIALAQKEKILTRNVKDFSKIPGLQVETY